MCGELFQADRRVGARQRACGRPECQQKRRQQTQRRWRQRHPDYFVDRRLRQRALWAAVRKRGYLAVNRAFG